MKYLYTQDMIYGQTRIIGVSTVKDDHPNASNTFVNLTDEYNRPVYTLSNGEPVYVGPVQFPNENEKLKSIGNKLLKEYSTSELFMMIIEITENIKGSGVLRKETTDFLNKVKQLIKDIT